MVDPQRPISYFGGYLSLIGIAQMLIFIYLLLFYRGKINRAKNLFTLRFVVCIITIGISLLVLVMIITKTSSYVSQTQSKLGKQYGMIMAVNILDILITIYTIPSYIFLSICHYRQLRQFNQNQHQNRIDTDRQNIQIHHQNGVGQYQNIQIRISQEQRITCPSTNNITSS